MKTRTKLHIFLIMVSILFVVISFNNCGNGDSTPEKNADNVENKDTNDIFNETNLNDTKNNSNNQTQNINNNLVQSCEAEKGYPLKVNRNSKTPRSSFDAHWGLSLTENYIAWEYQIEPAPWGGTRTVSIMIYDRKTCTAFDPLENMMVAPEGFTEIFYSLPRIDNNKMAYYKLFGTTNLSDPSQIQLWVYNIETKEHKQITDDKYDTNKKRYHDINGNYVVWTEHRDEIEDSNQVFLYNLVTDEEKCITCGGGDKIGRQNTTAWDDYISWLECRDSYYCDVVLYQISKNEITNITNTGGDENRIVKTKPVVKNNKIAWAESRNDDGEYTEGFAKNYDIFIYDLETNTETQLTNTPYQELKVWPGERYVAFTDARDFDYDLRQEWRSRENHAVVVDLQTGKQLLFEKNTRGPHWVCNTIDDVRIEGKYFLYWRPDADASCDFDGELYLYDLEQLDWDSGVVPAVFD